jgi:hypothetical protein
MSKALDALKDVEEPETYDDEIEEEPQPVVEKKVSKRGIQGKENIERLAKKPEIQRVDQLPDDEIVEIRVRKDHTHVVGKNTYQYKAMEATTVPKNVAEILKESGLLYEGGIAMHLGKKNKVKDNKPVVLPPISQWEDEPDA